MSFQGFWLNDWRWPYLVRYNGGPYWSTSDMYPQRLLDPTNDSSAMCIDCCVDAPTGRFARQYKSCTPYKAFSDNTQNGGDLLAITDDGWIVAFATQDVDHGRLYYFVGPGLYQSGSMPGGWVIAGPDLDNTWRSVVTPIQQAAPDPYTRLGSLSLAYTQYTLQDLDTPYYVNGNSPGISRISCIISEHYNGANPQQAIEMERFIYGQWRGLMRWEHWVQQQVPPAPQVLDRAPAFPFAYPTALPLNPALILGDCRTWVNWTTGLSALPVQTVGWPASVILP